MAKHALTPLPFGQLMMADDGFLSDLGAFHVVWASIDMIVDFLIGKFLKTNIQETHVLTSGMEFGRKARLLRDVVKRSEHKNKAAILGQLNKLQNETKRNAFAHSYIHSSKTDVTFVERSHGGEYKVNLHTYTRATFREHLKKCAKAGMDLYEAGEVSRAELDTFANAAANLAKS